MYLLEYTEDLDAVASDPISRALVTPGAGHPSIQSVGFYPGENKVRNGGGSDGRACLCESISRLSPSSPLVSVCAHESLNGRKIKGYGLGLRRVLSLSVFLIDIVISDVSHHNSRPFPSPTTTSVFVLAVVVPVASVHRPPAAPGVQP